MIEDSQVKAELSEITPELSWMVLAAVGILAGSGFTMALFIANQAFSPNLINAAKLGILSAPIFSAVAGVTLLRIYSGRGRFSGTSK